MTKDAHEVLRQFIRGVSSETAVLRKWQRCSKLDGMLRTERNRIHEYLHPFKWRHFQADIILLCVRGYLRYPLSYRDLEEMMRERGLHIDHITIYRWVQHYAPGWRSAIGPISR